MITNSLSVLHLAEFVLVKTVCFYLFNSFFLLKLFSPLGTPISLQSAEREGSMCCMMIPIQCYRQNILVPMEREKKIQIQSRIYPLSILKIRLS